jgi:hypothetical protein
MTMIDMNRPVEAVRKSDGKVVPLGMPKPTTMGVGAVARFATEKGPCQSTSNELWYMDGRDYCYRKEWTIRNVPAVALGTLLRCRTFDATVVAVAPSGDLMVETTGSSPCYYRLDAATLKDTDGDTWEVVVPPPPAPSMVDVYRNIYADGSIGRTAHKTRQEAMRYSTYGKVRVGILEQEMEGDLVVEASVSPTAPQLREYDNPTGYNPYAS